MASIKSTPPEAVIGVGGPPEKKLATELRDKREKLIEEAAQLKAELVKIEDPAEREAATNKIGVLRAMIHAMSEQINTVEAGGATHH